MDQTFRNKQKKDLSHPFHRCGKWYSQKVCKRHGEPLSELKTIATPFPIGCEQKAPERDVQEKSLVKCLTKSLVDLFLSFHFYLQPWASWAERRRGKLMGGNEYSYKLIKERCVWPNEKTIFFSTPSAKVKNSQGQS